MEMFVDAYDWVMVPNVYAMSQFADGGGMYTKPYISGSNYLMKIVPIPTASEIDVNPRDSSLANNPVKMRSTIHGPL